MLGHSEKEQHLFIPNIENFQAYHNRLDKLEVDMRQKINEFTYLDDYIEQKLIKFNAANKCKYVEEIETLKNKIWQLENHNSSLQYVISQHSTNTNLILNLYLKLENDFKKIDKWIELTQKLGCDNTENINAIRNVLHDNQNLLNIIGNIQKELNHLQQWADITDGRITENTNNIIQKYNDLNTR